MALMTKICAWCGKEFQTTSGTKKYCDDIHYDNCVICGKQYEVPKSMMSDPTRARTCSKECRRKLREATNLGKYGGVAPACSADIQAKMQQTTLERFGVAHAAQADVCKEKSKATCLERYGEEFYAQTEQGKARVVNQWQQPGYKDQVHEHTAATNLERYGVENTFQVQEFRDKAKTTMLEKYGVDHYSKTEEFRTALSELWADPEHKAERQSHITATVQERYGVSCALAAPEVRAKAKATLIEKYGVDNYLSSEEGQARWRATMQEKYGGVYSQTAEWKADRITDPKLVQNLMEFDADPAAYIQSHFAYKPSLKEVAATIGTTTDSVSIRAKRAKCTDLIAYVYSNMEHEVYQFLKERTYGLEIERNTKAIITPYELDIYIPKYKLAIECNPTSTHNSSINTFDRSAAPTAPGYHKMKSDLCEEKGIFLYHIFGYDWEHKKAVVKSMLINLIGESFSRCYARQTDIHQVDASEAFKFLDENHRQGGVHCKVRLGLYHKNTLVALMTFSKLRNSIGPKDSEAWELVRFCNKRNTRVVGGASKLFKHFIDMCKPTRVISFSDRAHTKGGLYQQLGFTEVARSSPNYVWVHEYTEKAYHRINAQKSNIKRFLQDETLDLTKSERELMISHHFLQVYDSGTITWEWRPQK